MTVGVKSDTFAPLVWFAVGQVWVRGGYGRRAGRGCLRGTARCSECSGLVAGLS
jgi:hypothetical protein